MGAHKSLPAELVNPFRPTAGAEPPVLIGREKAISDFTLGLREGVGAPARLMRVTGPRGSGKTVLLTEFGDIARDAGWRVCDVTAIDDLTGNIIHLLGRGDTSSEAEFTANLGMVKARVKRSADEDEVTLRDVLTRETSRLTEDGVGLLVTVDEIQDAQESDVRLIATSVQHLIRERKNIAFVFAGLTTGVMDLMNGRALTFLRRAKAEDLAPIPIEDVASAMRSSIEESGLAISDGDLEKMARATRGYAFLVQLIGYNVWAQAASHCQLSVEIDDDDVERGIREALREFNDTVLEVAVSNVPLKAMEYLFAMACDDGVSSTAEVAKRIGVPATSLTSYRRMLVKRQVIEPTARGYVTFSIPYMREFLEERKEEILARYGM